MVSEGLYQEFNCLRYSLMKSTSVTIRILSKGMHNLKKRQAFKVSTERHLNQR